MISLVVLLEAFDIISITHSGQCYFLILISFEILFVSVFHKEANVSLPHKQYL